MTMQKSASNAQTGTFVQFAATVPEVSRRSRRMYIRNYEYPKNQQEIFYDEYRSRCAPSPAVALKTVEGAIFIHVGGENEFHHVYYWHFGSWHPLSWQTQHPLYTSRVFGFSGRNLGWFSLNTVKKGTIPDERGERDPRWQQRLCEYLAQGQTSPITSAEKHRVSQMDVANCPKKAKLDIHTELASGSGPAIGQNPAWNMQAGSSTLRPAYETSRTEQYFVSPFSDAFKVNASPLTMMPHTAASVQAAQHAVHGHGEAPSSDGITDHPENAQTCHLNLQQTGGTLGCQCSPAIQMPQQSSHDSQPQSSSVSGEAALATSQMSKNISGHTESPPNHVIHNAVINGSSVHPPTNEKASTATQGGRSSQQLQFETDHSTVEQDASTPAQATDSALLAGELDSYVYGPTPRPSQPLDNHSSLDETDEKIERLMVFLIEKNQLYEATEQKLRDSEAASRASQREASVRQEQIESLKADNASLRRVQEERLRAHDTELQELRNAMREKSDEAQGWRDSYSRLATSTEKMQVQFSELERVLAAKDDDMGELRTAHAEHIRNLHMEAAAAKQMCRQQQVSKDQEILTLRRALEVECVRARSLQEVKTRMEENIRYILDNDPCVPT